MLVMDSRTSSADGAFGRHERQDSAGNEARHRRVAVRIEGPQVDCMKEVGTNNKREGPPLRQRCLNNRSS